MDEVPDGEGRLTPALLSSSHHIPRWEDAVLHFPLVLVCPSTAPSGFFFFQVFSHPLESFLHTGC